MKNKNERRRRTVVQSWNNVKQEEETRFTNYMYTSSCIEINVEDLRIHPKKLAQGERVFNPHINTAMWHEFNFSKITQVKKTLVYEIWKLMIQVTITCLPMSIIKWLISWTTMEKSLVWAKCSFFSNKERNIR